MTRVQKLNFIKENRALLNPHLTNKMIACSTNEELDEIINDLNHHPALMLAVEQLPPPPSIIYHYVKK